MERMAGKEQLFNRGCFSADTSQKRKAGLDPTFPTTYLPVNQWVPERQNSFVEFNPAGPTAFKENSILNMQRVKLSLIGFE